MTLEKAIELKAAVGRLMYSNNKDVRDYNALIDFIESALRPVSREQVERIRGEWKNFKPLIECQICGEIYNKYGENEGKPFDFCPACGTPLTDEAVDILFKRLEALKDGKME